MWQASKGEGCTERALPCLRGTTLIRHRLHSQHASVWSAMASWGATFAATATFSTMTRPSYSTTVTTVASAELGAAPTCSTARGVMCATPRPRTTHASLVHGRATAVCASRCSTPHCQCQRQPTHLCGVFISGAGNTALVQLAQARDSCQLWPRRSLGVPRQAPQVTQVHQVAWWSFTLIMPDTPFTHAQGDVPTVQQVHGGRRRHHCPH